MEKFSKVLIVLSIIGLLTYNCKSRNHEKDITSKKTENVKKGEKKIIDNNIDIHDIIINNNEMVIEEIVFEDISEIKISDEDVFYSGISAHKHIHNTTDYNYIEDNEYKSAIQEPLSTFSIDVDNASYSEVRHFLNIEQLPYKDAVRIEEMINYFDYNYEQPKGDVPFNVYTEMANAPWNEKHNLVMIGLKGKELDYNNLKSSNLVFLIDTSGSMSSNNKLPLLIKSFKVLVNNLPAGSRVAIVTYTGSAGLVLPSTNIKNKKIILNTLDNLEAGGSTAGGAGIELAYKVAEENYIKKGNNRVILATDGDFNVGISSTSELIRTIQEKKKSGVYITILGFGMGNYKDGRMEEISNKGNGNYFYIDNYTEAKKVFKNDLVANMFTIAKDVKIQVEFNPRKVKAYRLIGYANRKLEAEDFNDDKIDAGELGAGHCVTAFYEIIPAASNEKVRSHDDLKYQKVEVVSDSSELMTVKLRYKPIKSDTSKLISIPVEDDNKSWEETSSDFQFASSVAGFGMLLRDSEFKGNVTPQLVRELAMQQREGNDIYKNEFITLIDKYEILISEAK